MKRPFVVLALLLLVSTSDAQLVPQDFAVEQLASGLSEPVAMAYLPDGRLLVAEQRTGNVRLLLADGSLQMDPVLTVTGIESGPNEAGLLSLAVDPNWPSSPYIYCHFTNDTPSEMRLHRYRGSGDLDAPASDNLSFGAADELLTGIPFAAGNHNGGSLRFGPDGHLYFSIGDDENQCAVYDADRFEGKVLRLRVDNIGLSRPIPRSSLIAPGNPFVGEGSIASLVWTEGVRNPFRMVIDPDDGALFVADVGQSSREEISRVDTAGVNLGWPFREGFLPHSPGDGCSEPSGAVYQDPIWDYPRSEGFSVIGAFVYRAPDGATAAWPAEYEGDFFYADFYIGDLRRLTGSGQSWSIAPAVADQPSTANWGEGFGFVPDYAIAPDGSVTWISLQFGTVHRIRYTGAPVDAPAPPRTELAIQAQPTPFNPVTTIVFRGPQNTPLEVTVLDARGRHVATLFDGIAQGVEQTVRWTADALPSGVYHVRVAGPEGTRSRKVVLAK